jgi:hypothetical protein
MAYQTAKANHKKTGFRKPKDWIKHFSEKLPVKTQDTLTRTAKYFTTVWGDIDIVKYFECGFDLFDKFSYHNFFDKKIMLLYIQRDKIKKNEYIDMKKALVNSCKYVKKYLMEKSVSNDLKSYCLLIEDNRPVIIGHYLKNHVDGYFLTWMIAEKLFQPYEFVCLTPFLTKNYRDFFQKLNDERVFLEKLKEKMG